MACSAPGEARKRVMPPTYFLSALVLVIAARVALPRLTFVNPLSLVAGVAMLVAGVALNLMSDSAFKRRGTPVSPGATPVALVDTGAFRVTRNPMYLGMVLIVAAAALLVGEPIGLTVALALLWALNRFFVPREERNMLRVFGNQYQEYQAAVPRWI